MNEVIEAVRDAAARGVRLAVRGHASKHRLGGPHGGETLLMSASGITDYQPSELVITARAGTPLAEVEALLAAHGQALAFEPPRLGEAPHGGTVGGMVAAGLAGPARMAAGSLRDHLLGVRMVNGQGEWLRFGGTVIKNVAGYDVARLLGGSWGAIGVITEASLRVVPLAPAEATLRFTLGQDAALAHLSDWAAEPLPLSASAWWQGTLAVRLRGARAAVAAALARLAGHGGEPIAFEAAQGFWQGLRDQQDEFFTHAGLEDAAGHARLWRLALPPATRALDLPGDVLVEWHGAQRWLLTGAPPEAVQAAVRAAQGHARLWWGHTPPEPSALQQAVQAAFDPHGVFHTQRLT